ncbi:hypothetical protein Y032_0036g3269 [Ancylostoma ceylanicum]|uniref:Uncharacterized protein n=1 Tax=Ancylostoma ceylanicum TaxID=53326 RepID=A0A016ULD2_9BILA|nr:hypothetical protein Y032_0036g3269 [Ancylostoma ceylanicum]
MANREIVKKIITPYAPWQGDSFEPLIQTVKRAKYKTLGTKTPAEDTENGVGGNRGIIKLETTGLLRPVDTLQKDMLITQDDTTSPTNEDSQDERYLPP